MSISTYTLEEKFRFDHNIELARVVPLAGSSAVVLIPSADDREIASKQGYVAQLYQKEAEVGRLKTPPPPEAYKESLIPEELETASISAFTTRADLFYEAINMLAKSLPYLHSQFRAEFCSHRKTTNIVLIENPEIAKPKMSPKQEMEQLKLDLTNIMLHETKDYKEPDKHPEYQPKMFGKIKTYVTKIQKGALKPPSNKDEDLISADFGFAHGSAEFQKVVKLKAPLNDESNLPKITKALENFYYDTTEQGKFLINIDSIDNNIKLKFYCPDQIKAQLYKFEFKMLLGDDLNLQDSKDQANQR